MIIVEFIYNNAKNTGIVYRFFKFNCRYNLHILYKENIKPYSQTKLVNNLLIEFYNYLITCQKNFDYL